MPVATSAIGSTMQDLGGVSILVLDDDSNMRSLIRGALSRSGCKNILLSGDARDALRMFSDRTIDVVILDLMMEPMSGLDFLRELRRPERAIDVPVIMLSASTEPKDIAAAQMFKISGWLTKPIALADLLKQISAVLTMSDTPATLDKALTQDIERLADRYRSKLVDDLRVVDEALGAMQQQKEIDGTSWASAAERSTTWAMVDRVMHNIKGQAGNFNLNLIAAIAGLGQELTRPMTNSTYLVHHYHDEVHRCAATLVQAMRIVLQNGIRGNGGQMGDRLLQKLKVHTGQIQAKFASDVTSFRP